MSYSPENAINQLWEYLRQYHENEPLPDNDEELRLRFPDLCRVAPRISLIKIIDTIEQKEFDHPVTTDPIEHSIRFVQAVDLTVKHHLHEHNQPNKVKKVLGPELTRLAVSFGKSIKTK